MDYLVVLLRVVTIVPFLLIVTLLMGKRLVGELQVFDFLIAIVLGAVVGADIADPSIEHAPTAFAVLLLGVSQWAISRLNIQFRSFGHITTFEPTIVIQNGQFLPKQMKKIRYSLDTILELLREKDAFRVSEVEFAVIEANGKLSVLKKSQFQPLTPSVAGTPTEYYGISHTVILEGKIVEETLTAMERDKEWLLEELKNQKYDLLDIFFAELDSNYTLHVSSYHPRNPQLNLRH